MVSQKRCRIIEKSLAFLFLSSLILAGSIIGYWNFLSCSPVKVNYAVDKFLSYPVTNRNDIPKAEITKVHAGQVVYQYIDYCVRSAKPGSVVEIYQDGITFTLPPRATISEVGCFRRNFPRVIPATLPPGEYTYTIEIRTRVNPLSVIELKIKSISFEIVE